MHLRCCEANNEEGAKTMEHTTKKRLGYLRWRLGTDAECAMKGMLKVAARHMPCRDGRGFGHSDEILLSFAG